jgi:hypothetical protein
MSEGRVGVRFPDPMQDLGQWGEWAKQRVPITLEVPYQGKGKERRV